MKNRYRRKAAKHLRRKRKKRKILITIKNEMSYKRLEKKHIKSIVPFAYE